MLNIRKCDITVFSEALKGILLLLEFVDDNICTNFNM